MKLTVLGGAGVRMPLLIQGLIREGAAGVFDQVVLCDIDETHLALIGCLAQHLLDHAQSPIQLAYTTNARDALKDADFVFSAIRVGNSASRIIDEKVALAHHVIGQETIGPGGFAMALRTIPVVLAYADLIRQVAPNAWLLNFTNPAGIVTQALIDQGFTRTIGICDSPEGLKKRVAKYLGVAPRQVQMTYAGLNHLGWVTDVRVDGQSKLSYLLDHYADMSRDDAEFAAFDPDLVRSLGMLPNEYLYYFYYASDAVAHIQAVGETRGMQIRRLTDALFTGVDDALSAGDPARAWQVYAKTMGMRSQTYMQREINASGDARTDRPAVIEEDAGYAGVALRVAQSMVGQAEVPMIVNIANQHAVPSLEPSDVVEIPTAFDRSGPHPLALGPLPRSIEGLILAVKQYERLTVKAAVTGDRQTAIDALTAHPLVPSYTTARRLVDDYLRELKDWLPQF